MSIFSKHSTKPPKKDVLEDRATELRLRISEIKTELSSLNDDLAEQTALGNSLSETLNKINLLETEVKTIPRSLKLLEREIREMNAAEIQARFDVLRQSAIEAKKETAPYIVKIEAAVAEYLDFIKGKDFGKLTTNSDYVGKVLVNVRSSSGLGQVFGDCLDNINSQEARHVYAARADKGAAFGSIAIDK